MNTTDHEPSPPAATPEAAKPGSPVARPPTSKAKVSQLSASTQAFIAQMAENLRTHDPENPKGRLRKQP